MGARGKESHDLFLNAPEKRRNEVEQGDTIQLDLTKGKGCLAKQEHSGSNIKNH